jgi:hypothetical protein
MADSKISALPAATTALAGTEVLPIVQCSTTKQVSVANLTAGRAISATQLTLTTGNVIVASGQGIDFSATADGPNRTSELFNDYEEGTWSPSIGGSTTYSDQVGYYTKCGNVVTVSGRMAINSQAGNANTYQITNLPFTSKTTGNGKAGGGTIGTYSGLAISVIALSSYVEGNTTNMVFTYVVISANSNLTATIFGNNADIYFSATYLSA